MLRFAIYLRAPNDINGNPRRGWAVFRITERGSIGERWVEEGYHGHGAMKLAFGDDAAKIPYTTVNVSISEIRSWRAGDWLGETD